MESVRYYLFQPVKVKTLVNTVKVPKELKDPNQRHETDKKLIFYIVDLSSK